MRFASLLGMFDGLIDKISNFFTDFGNSIFHSGLMKIIGTVLYGLSYALFLVIDFLSMFFRRIVGLETGVTLDLETGGSQAIEGDIVLTLIQSKEVMNVFFALLIVAVFLLFVSTIVAIIKSEYNFDKGGNAKGPIFGRAIKALFYFLSVPTICIFGVFMANQLLLLLDQATRQSTSTKISSLVFASCSEKANRVLNDTTFWNGYRKSEAVSGAKSGGGAFFYRNATTDGTDIQDTTENREGIAYGINSAFANETTMNDITNGSITFGSGKKDGGFNWATDYDMGRPSTVDSDYSRSAFKAHYGLSIKNVSPSSTFSVYNVDLVWFYFDLMSYDHLVSLLASFLILKSLFDLSMGVVKRIYEMIVLFCVSPPIVALMPLDEGAAYKNWTKAFVGKTLAAYGGVLAMNFFFMLVPVLRRINVFGTNGVMFGSINLSSVFNYLAQLMMIIAGAVSLTSISGMISGLIGADDAVESGSKISGAVAGVAAQMGGMALGLGKAAIAKGVGVAKGIKNRKAEKKEITGKPDEDANEMAETTGNIAREVDANQAIGNNTNSGTPPTNGGGDPSGGGGPSGGGNPDSSQAVSGGSSDSGSSGGSSASSSAGGQSNGMVSGSASGGTSSSSTPTTYDRKVQRAYDKTFGGAMKNFAHSARTGNVAGMTTSGLRAGFQVGKGVLKFGGKLLKGMAGIAASQMLGENFDKVSKSFKGASANEAFDGMMAKRRENKAQLRADVKAYGHERWRAGVKVKYDAKVAKEAWQANHKRDIKHDKHQIKISKEREDAMKKELREHKKDEARFKKEMGERYEGSLREESARSHIEISNRQLKLLKEQTKKKKQQLKNTKKQKY